MTCLFNDYCTQQKAPTHQKGVEKNSKEEVIKGEKKRHLTHNICFSGRKAF